MKKDCQSQNKNPVRILYVNGGVLDLGGISSYMINYFRRIDKNICHIDFAVHGNSVGIYDIEIEKAGSVIYHLPIKSRDYFGNVKALKKILREGNYDIVHSHLDAGSYHILKIAKQCGVPLRIAHSHSTNYLTRGKIKTIINEYYRKNITKVSTHLMACSDSAGKWLFGEESNFTVIKNAMELNRFVFSKETRDIVRNNLGFENDCIVLGHVGLFDVHKNQSFLIEVFSELVKKKKYRLVLVGDGPLRSTIEKKAKELGLYDFVSFVGYTKNIEQYYSAFDIFLLPSLFEGLGMVAVEAQVSGLPCILSDTVPKAAQILPGVLYLPLKKVEWVDSILSMDTSRMEDTLNAAEKMHYDIFQESRYLQSIYCNLVEDHIYKEGKRI